MPHNTIWEKEGIYWQFFGIVPLQEIREADNEVYGDARFDDLKYFIWDATDVKQLDLSENEVDVPASLDTITTSYKPTMKGAFVAGDKGVRGGIERYIKTSLELGSTWKFKLFENIQDARKWVAS